MTVTDIAREIDINRNSVAKYLDILLISGHAEMITFGPAKVFFPSRRIPLSALLNFTMDYVILLDKDLKFLQMNEKLCDLLEIKREDMIGQHIQEIPTSIFQIQDLLENAQKALSGTETIIETTIRQDDEERYVHIKNIPTTFDDGEPGVTLIIEDITERKQTEAQMKQAVKEWDITFNSVSDMITIHDNNNTIIRANTSFAQFFNCSPEECIGKKCYEFIHGTTQTHNPCPCTTLQETKQPASVEFFEPHIEKTLVITASPILDDEGNVTSSVHIIKIKKE